MPRDHYTDCSETRLKPLTDDELAEWSRSQGRRVILKFGRYWNETVRGFYQPLHYLAGFTAEKVRKPARLCWGYQATFLCEKDKSFANSYMPVNTLPNLSGYDSGRLSANRRYQLRRCRSHIDIVSLNNADALDRDGYRVYSSMWKRTGWGGYKTKDEYRRSLAALNEIKKAVILVGIMDERIEGYVTGYAVGSVACLGNMVIATEALKTHIGIGLTFEFIQACRRSHGVRELVHGLDTPEDPSLTQYKQSMGFKVNPVPSITHMLPFFAVYIRRRQPYKYYRLTGYLPGQKC